MHSRCPSPPAAKLALERTGGASWAAPRWHAGSRPLARRHPPTAGRSAAGWRPPDRWRAGRVSGGGQSRQQSAACHGSAGTSSCWRATPPPSCLGWRAVARAYWSKSVLPGSASCPPWARQRARTVAAPCLPHPPPRGPSGKHRLRPCHWFLSPPTPSRGLCWGALRVR